MYVRYSLKLWYGNYGSTYKNVQCPNVFERVFSECWKVFVVTIKRTNTKYFYAIKDLTIYVSIWCAVSEWDLSLCLLQFSVSYWFLTSINTGYMLTHTIGKGNTVPISNNRYILHMSWKKNCYLLSKVESETPRFIFCSCLFRSKIPEECSHLHLLYTTWTV